MQDKVEFAEIGRRSYTVHSDIANSEDSNFLELLITLGVMELGPEFERPYEELDKIADDLIAGKDVIL